MKILQELADAGLVLTDTQKIVLTTIYASATAQVAYESTIGAQNIVNARDTLRRLGLVAVSDSQKVARCTTEGESALENISAIDEMGELTDYGNELASKIEQLKLSFNESLLPFKILNEF